MAFYLIIGVNVVLFILLLRSMYKRNRQTNDEYHHAVKRLFENNPDIRDKMKDKYKF